MTGEYNGAIRKLDELLWKPLQWCICLLHCVELPLKHVYLLVDGTSTAPDSFLGLIGNCVAKYQIGVSQNLGQ